MLPLLAVTLFLILPTLFVWRLSRLPIRGDLQLESMWRGAVAGLCGGIIGATLSSFIFGAGAYAPIGYLFWLVVTAILGMVFMFVIVAIQKSGLSLSLLSRAAIGAVTGIVTAWVWVSIIRSDPGNPMNWFDRGIIGMMVGSGIVSGILGGPLKEES
jgi:hypothetical protein